MHMYNRLAMRAVGLFGLVALSSLAVCCYAQDAYTLGSKSAQKGDFRTAAGYFEKVVAASPGNPVAHYQLANCYIQLHRRVEAKNEYQKCLSLHPDSVTQGYCEKMLAVMGGSQSSGSATPASGSTQQAAGASAGNDARKQEVLKQAQQEADKIKQQAEEQLKQLQQNTSERVWGNGYGQQQKDQIMGEAEAKAKKILDQAQDRVKHMQ
jgi:tetratricopeptide (TPR) repeat protein